MTSDDLEAAYAPFIATLLAGGFRDPADGWPAELIAAHVAANNDLIAHAATTTPARSAMRSWLPSLAMPAAFPASPGRLSGPPPGWLPRARR
jgi:hypothetical protein